MKQLIMAFSAFDCTLFTMARDGIGRFWSPIDPKIDRTLHLCAVVDPNQSLVTAESDEDNIPHVGDDDDFSPIHYIGCDELQSSLYTQLQGHWKHERLHQSLERMKDLIKDTPDLLFRIQPDGSLTFWGVQVWFFL